MVLNDAGDAVREDRDFREVLEGLKALLEKALYIEAANHLARARKEASGEKRPGRAGFRQRQLVVSVCGNAEGLMEVRVPRLRHAPGFKPRALMCVETAPSYWFGAVGDALDDVDRRQGAARLLEELTGRAPEDEAVEEVVTLWDALRPSSPCGSERERVPAGCAEESAVHLGLPEFGRAIGQWGCLVGERVVQCFRVALAGLRSVPGRLDRAGFEGRGLRLPLGLAGTLAVGFAALGFAVLDMPIARFFYRLRTGEAPLVWAFFGIERLGTSTFYLLTSAALALWAGWKGWAWYKKPLYVFLSIGLAGVVVNIIKYVAGRARPLAYFEDGLWGFYWFETDALLRSFPSGHAATALALGGALAYLFPGAGRLWWLAGLVVAFARVITSEHYFGDFVFGAFVGAATAVVLSRVMFTPVPGGSKSVQG